MNGGQPADLVVDTQRPEVAESVLHQRMQVVFDVQIGGTVRVSAHQHARVGLLQYHLDTLGEGEGLARAERTGDHHRSSRRSTIGRHGHNGLPLLQVQSR